MSNILVNNNFYISTSSACIVDLTPPTFAGINFLDVESRGQIRAGWSAATDATAPIRYEVYIKPTNVIGLFNVANIIASTPNLQFDIFNLPDGSFLVNGTTYYVGVRALDGLSNRDSNLVSMSVISTGVLTSIDVYRNEAVFSVDDSNAFVGSLWSTKNESLANSPGAVLGAASYQVYNNAGVAVVGMSESGITANAQGIYIISPVPYLITDNGDHYVVKVTISVDGEDRVNHIPVPSRGEIYEIGGVSSVNDSNQIIGSFWITENETILTSGLGLGSYQAYSADGVMIPGLSESNISPNVNGVFVISPVAVPGYVDTRQAFVVRLTIVANGVTRTHNLPISATAVDYSCKAAFSINALNQLEATLWGTVSAQTADFAILGTASYQVYDKNGTAIPGLSESGLTPDVNGLFHTTPVSAILLADLTHYTVRVTIEIAGTDRVCHKGFTLLGT